MTSTAALSRPQGASADRQLLAFMLSASLASTIGGLPFNALPVMLGSLADSFALAPQAVGLLGSICFAGYLLGTLGAPFWMNRVDWRVLTGVSAAGTAGAFAASAWLRDLTALYIAWAAIGFFASTMTCLGMRILSDLPNKVRAFGVRQGVELSVTAAVLFALPPLVLAQYRYSGGALAMAAVVLLLGLSALWVPARPAIDLSGFGAQVEQPRSGLRFSAAAWLGLSVFFVFLVGNIGLWAFLERIGAVLKLAPAETGLVFAVLKLLGGVAAFSVAALGERPAPRSAFALVLLGVVAGLLLLGGAGSFLPFALGAWIWEFAFTCGCVFQTAAIARSDASGRAVLLVPAAFALSSMVGPALAGKLLAQDGGAFLPVLMLALASSVVPLLAAVLGGRRG
jgi:predicted MFS family arabinose efflux permease